MNKKVDVLITGADQRQGLAVIRSLGRRGVSVVAAGPDPNSLGFSSRYAAASWVYPSPFEQPGAFVESICEAARRFQVRLVMPVVESTVAVLNEHREMIESVAPLAMASREAVSLALDKRSQYLLAQQHEIPIPKTMVPISMQEVDARIAGLHFPVVVKPNQKPHGTSASSGDFKVTFVADEDALRKLLAIYFRHSVVPIVQELCVGHGIGFGVLMHHGQPLACYQYHRGRELMPTGGVPVRYESMPIWPNVQDYSVRFLRAMGWEGVAQVEWKAMPGTRDVVLMEVNGRFWASLPGSLHAGMEFPFWLYQSQLGEPVHYDRPYRQKVASRYLQADLKRLELVLRHDFPISSVPLPSKWRECMDFVLDGFRWRVKGDIWSWDDWSPGLQEAWKIIMYFWNRANQRTLGPKVEG
jgi:predicted ATP-grasp superfamily ATP-dependent carboligase